MANQETCNWIGTSGKKYLYYVYPRHPNVEAADGNYIYAKKNVQRGYGSLSISAKVIFQSELPETITASSALT